MLGRRTVGRRIRFNTSPRRESGGAAWWRIPFSKPRTVAAVAARAEKPPRVRSGQSTSEFGDFGFEFGDAATEFGDEFRIVRGS